ncbi:hypothetical protein UFOVP699_89 [uncultured Caudovirales phage]|uniref:Uncharacterized protein n=1 Tax=uncultured Caudovirales phage TaxID=2100421 RepID=A0A6J5NHU0_9CAUD|nr:hypothetical protein UFOVP699_89 [uncultured Caudovirales phage]
MKNNTSITVGPLKKSTPTTTIPLVLNDRLSKMKVGNLFEVTGLSTKADIMNFRGSVKYHAKKYNISIKTKVVNEKLIVERVKTVKTKEASSVKY